MLELSVFWIVAAITLTSTVLIFYSKNVMHSAVFFAFTMLMVGGIYVMLGSYFLAFIHVMVYAGAVSILIVFAIMVTRKGGMNEL